MIGRKADDAALAFYRFGAEQGIVILQCRCAGLQGGEIILKHIDAVIGRVSDAIGARIACT